MSASSQKGRPPSGKSKKTNQLLSKEEEFMRLNAALEEKTANLFSEAESVLREQESLLSRGTHTSDDDGILAHTERDTGNTSRPTSKSSLSQRPQSSKTKERPTSHSLITSKAASRAGAKTKKARPSSGSRPTSEVSNNEYSVDILQERVNLAHTISALEQQMADENYTPSKMNEQVLPEAANEMGEEAVIRFLKAKLRVMQEELDRVTTENNEQETMIKSLQSKVKELSDEQQQLNKTKQSLQSQVDKWKKLHGDAKTQNQETEQHLVAAKKEINGLKREQQQVASNKNAVDVRLNRALEEAEKYKSALQKARETSKDSSDQDKRRVEQLTAENKRLERQRNELVAAFKKQLKLIDILKRQKMHIEAAKMLQFSEEEFVKALDWGS